MFSEWGSSHYSQSQLCPFSREYAIAYRPIKTPKLTTSKIEGRKVTAPVWFPTLWHGKGSCGFIMSEAPADLHCRLIGKWIQNWLRSLRKMFLFGLDMTEIITLKAFYGFIFPGYILCGAYYSPLLGNLCSFSSRTALPFAWGMWHFKQSIVVSYFHRKR